MCVLRFFFDLFYFYNVLRPSDGYSVLPLRFTSLELLDVSAMDINVVKLYFSSLLVAAIRTTVTLPLYMRGHQNKKSDHSFLSNCVFIHVVYNNKCFCFVLQNWGLNPRPHTCWSSAFTTDLSPQLLSQQTQQMQTNFRA